MADIKVNVTKGVSAESLTKTITTVEEYKNEVEINKDIVVDTSNQFVSDVNASTTAFNNNVTDKTNTFDGNVITKTNSFNTNAVDKTTLFNDNYTTKKGLIDISESNADTSANTATTKANEALASAELAKGYAESINPSSLYTKTELEGAIGKLSNPLCDIPFNQNINMKSGSGSVSVERASTDTKVNMYGEIESLAIDEASVADGITIEESSTNLQLQSEKMLSTHWTKQSGAVLLEDYDSIDGNTNAGLLSANTNGDTSIYLTSPFTFTSGSTYTHSVYVDVSKFSTGGEFRLYLHSTVYGGNGGHVNIDKDGTSGLYNPSGVVVSHDVEHIVGNTYRLQITGISTITGSSNYGNLLWYLADSISTTDGAIVSFPQLEELDYASSYIPTTDTPVTRALPFVTLPAKYNLPSPTEGSICFDFKVKSFNNSYNNIFGLYSASNVGLAIQITNSGSVRVYNYNNGTQYTESSIDTLQKGVQYNLKLIWVNGKYNLYINNTVVLSNISIPEGIYDKTLLEYNLGFGNLSSTSTDNTNANMEFKNFKTYNHALSDVEINLLGGN